VFVALNENTVMIIDVRKKMAHEEHLLPDPLDPTQTVKVMIVVLEYDDISAKCSVTLPIHTK
jgi:hypothetical protein